MDLHNTPVRAVRHDGWTEERKTRFLDCLAGRGNVRLACRAVQLSPEGAYRLKRREPLFARAWAAALLLARDASEQVLADRAIEGVEENVWYRGELLETRRKYDTRLFLAHLARLDKLADEAAAGADAARFDELLACIAGAEVPPDLQDNMGLPIDREGAVQRAKEGFEYEYEDEHEDDEEKEDGEFDGDAYVAGLFAARERGRIAGAAMWDGWFAHACETVDRTLDCCGPASGASAQAAAEGANPPEVLYPRTVSTPSTSGFVQSVAMAGKGPAGGPPAPNRAARRALKARQRRGRR